MKYDKISLKNKLLNFSLFFFFLFLSISGQKLSDVSTFRYSMIHCKYVIWAFKKKVQNRSSILLYYIICTCKRFLFLNIYFHFVLKIIYWYLHSNVIFSNLYRTQFPNFSPIPHPSMNSHRLSNKLKSTEEANGDAMLVFLSDVWLDQLKVSVINIIF